MSLLVPTQRDRVDSHEDLDQDEIYFQNLLKLSESETYKHEFPWDFSPVDDYFVQSDHSKDDFSFRYTEENFGVTKPWSTIIQEIKELNKNAPPNVSYKVLFLARHGEGWHNIATSKYSKDDWFAKWRFVGTDGEISWGPDANLTELGIDQALENKQAWNQQLDNGAPLPSKFYVSPLQRSLRTLQYTWEDQPIPQPIVLEHLRETIGVHLCHQRSKKSEIKSQFPMVDFEEDFPEHDELAEKFSKKREELNEQFLRINKVLQDIFTKDKDHQFISITSHAGTIRAFITVIGHRKFTIPTGGMIPIVVKGTRKN
ncbi:phosphomutase [Scheffersomyces coipomensis]|uniref:phosphomutase n=1 Tax=Scheffersomyces coipomensis TaxID=1788519 RepID=UPI00315CC328